MLVTLFLMALHSTFFGPYKYGILPEMLPDKELSRANGLLEMSTFLAIICGTSIGSLTIALAGIVCVFGVSHVPRSGAKKLFTANPWAEISAGIRRLYGDRSLWLTV